MEERPEWFHATSGRLTGGIGLAVAAGVVVLVALDPSAPHAESVVVGAAFFAVVCWAALLRPRVGLTSDTLVLRSMIRTVHLPLAAIETMSVGQVLAVRVDGRRYVSPALGKPMRRVVREVRGGVAASPGVSASPRDTMPYVDFVETRIQQQRSDALRKRDSAAEGSTPPGGTEVRVEHAVPEIAALAVSALALVVTLLV